jgi:hypothetical protein
MNLDDRKMCAEFAGSEVLEVDPHSEEVYVLFGDQGCESAPHYETDPAAACSLLPKLWPLLTKIKKDWWIDTGEEFVHNEFELMDVFAWALENDPAEVCRLIVSAVKSLREKGG